MFQKKNKWKSKNYRKWISEKPCCMCGNTTSVCGHHEDGDIFNSGTAMKPPDTQCVPLCHLCHDLRHKIGPSEFWQGADYKKEMINLITEYIIKKGLK